MAQEAAVQRYEEPALGWPMVLRRQPARTAGRRPEGGGQDSRS